MTLQILFIVWFSVSVMLGLCGNIVMQSFLTRRGVNTSSLMRGMPGYLDKLYIDWCKANDKPYIFIIFLRWIVFLSAILAIITVPAHR
jgi:hypothetical protein